MMLPYLELPLCIGYGEGNEEKVVPCKIMPDKITAYHEGYYKEVGIFIYLDTQPLQIALTIEQFESRVKRYWELLANHAKLKLHQ